MESPTPQDDIFAEPLWIALTILLIAAATILGALAFQHLGGYQPCALCLMQRTPYYVGVPLAGLLALAIWRGASQPLVVLGFALLGLLMLYGAGLAAYHAGVEWRFWAGPATCAPSVSVGSAEAMLQSLKGGGHAPSCTDAVWRLLGLSFAGWNALVSLALVALAALGAARAYGSSSASQYR